MYNTETKWKILCQLMGSTKTEQESKTIKWICDLYCLAICDVTAKNYKKACRLFCVSLFKERFFRKGFVAYGNLTRLGFLPVCLHVVCFNRFFTGKRWSL